MINKIGDITVLLAIVLCFDLCCSTDFSILFILIPHISDLTLSFFDIKMLSISVISFFLFFGVLGKSAQIGLHI